MMKDIAPCQGNVTQLLLTKLADEGMLSLDKNSVTLLSNEELSFTLVPAYRLPSTADGEPNPYALVGHIRPGTNITALKTE